MSVRCKFKVDRTEKTTYGDGVVLTPVYNPDPASENGKFWKATPSGEIRFSSCNADAMAQFEVGKEYYVDFTLADG
jgi:hypothetical protein